MTQTLDHPLRPWLIIPDTFSLIKVFYLLSILQTSGLSIPSHLRAFLLAASAWNILLPIPQNQKAHDSPDSPPSQLKTPHGQASIVNIVSSRMAHECLAFPLSCRATETVWSSLLGGQILINMLTKGVCLHLPYSEFNPATFLMKIKDRNLRLHLQMHSMSDCLIFSVPEINTWFLQD